MLLARHEESTSSNPQSGASTTVSASIEPPPDTGVVTTVLAPGTTTSPPPPTSMTLPTAIAIPAYFGPVPLWDLMLNAVRTAEPSAPRIVLAVMNPASGPGAVADTGYLRVLEDARALGIRVFGYVATGYGTRLTVLDDIAAYQRFYGINDIFLDESPIECLWLQSVYAPWLATVHATPRPGPRNRKARRLLSRGRTPGLLPGPIVPSPLIIAAIRDLVNQVNRGRSSTPRINQA